MQYNFVVQTEKMFFNNIDIIKTLNYLIYYAD